MPKSVVLYREQQKMHTKSVVLYREQQLFPIGNNKENAHEK